MVGVMVVVVVVVVVVVSCVLTLCMRSITHPNSGAEGGAGRAGLRPRQREWPAGGRGRGEEWRGGGLYLGDVP